MLSAIIFPLSWFVERLSSDGFKENSNLGIAIVDAILVLVPYTKIITKGGRVILAKIV